MTSQRRQREQLEGLFDVDMDFDKFGPEVLKICIAWIERRFNTEGFLKSSHI